MVLKMVTNVLNSALKYITPSFENGIVPNQIEILLHNSTENFRNSLDCFKAPLEDLFSDNIENDKIIEDNNNNLDFLDSCNNSDDITFIDQFSNSIEEQLSNSNINNNDPIKYFLNLSSSNSSNSSISSIDSGIEEEDDEYISSNKIEYKIDDQKLDINFYVFKVIGWFLTHDSLYVMNHDFQEIKEYVYSCLQSAKNILEAHEIPISFLPIIVYYADKFVKRCGINHKQVFNLLLSAAIICVKYNGESVFVDYKIIGKHFNFSTTDICLMERLFLRGVDYELFVDPEIINNYLQNIEKENQIFINNISLNIK